jgi:Flp pilus assembly protein TadG
MRMTPSRYRIAAYFVDGPRGSLRRWRRNDHGSLTMETALGLSVLFTMVWGVMEFSMMGYTYSVYADAARAGVRYAITHGTDSSTCSGPSTGCADATGANVISTVTNYVTGFTTLASSVNVSVSYPDNSSAPPSRVIVTVSYKYKPMFALVGVHPSFSSTSAGRIEF